MYMKKKTIQISWLISETMLIWSESYIIGPISNLSIVRFDSEFKIQVPEHHQRWFKHLTPMFRPIMN